MNGLINLGSRGQAGSCNATVGTSTPSMHCLLSGTRVPAKISCPFYFIPSSYNAVYIGTTPVRSCKLEMQWLQLIAFATFATFHPNISLHSRSSLASTYKVKRDKVSVRKTRWVKWHEEFEIFVDMYKVIVPVWSNQRLEPRIRDNAQSYFH